MLPLLCQALAAIALGVAAAAATPAADVPSRPNFLIMFADDMGYGDMSGSGHPTISTPHLDRFAAEGMRFTQWYSAFHVCSPSRAAMLTGRLPIRSGTAGPSWTGGVFQNKARGGLPANETTFAELLRGVGYATLAVGKWHLGQAPQFLPTSRGFDEYLGVPYSVDMGDSAWQRRPGDVPLPLLQNSSVLEQPTNLNALESRYVQKVARFIHSNAQAQKPFLVYLAWSHVHTPDFVAPAWCNRSMRGRFGDAMEELDSHIGEVMKSLKDANVDEETLVFFTSDNGPWLIQRLAGGSAGPFFEGKSTTWEGGVREPGLARWPGRIPPGSVSRELVGTYDIFSTVVRLAGAELPSDRVIDGEDLSDVLFRGGRVARRCIFHYKGTPSSGLPPREDDPQPGLWAIRCGSYKAHFVTSCAVMQQWGDSRCGPAPADARGALEAFRQCQRNQTADECSLSLGSQPIFHSSPVLYNLDHDPGEMYPLSPQSTEYSDAMAEILRARQGHQATLSAVPNQMVKGAGKDLGICCDRAKACKCNPENYEPEGGVCEPVWPPTSERHTGSILAVRPGAAAGQLVV